MHSSLEQLYLEQANDFRDNGEYEASIQFYIKVLGLNPDNSLACYFLGLIHYLQHDWSAAIAYLARTLTLTLDSQRYPFGNTFHTKADVHRFLAWSYRMIGNNENYYLNLNLAYRLKPTLLESKYFSRSYKDKSSYDVLMDRDKVTTWLPSDSLPTNKN
jgi:tetratricopeptide (TPR) repeat protein